MTSFTSDAVVSETTSGMLCNRTFDELNLGDSACIERTLTAQDIELFAVLAGEALAKKPEEGAARGEDPHGIIVHGMWASGLLSAVLGTQLPGLGSRYLEQHLRFTAPIGVGDRVIFRAEVRAKDATTRQVTLACVGINQDGKTVVEGEAHVEALDARIELPRASLPDLRAEVIGQSGLQQLIEQVAGLAPINVAVVHPCDETSLLAAVHAYQAGLIMPTLIAPREKLQSVADHIGVKLSAFRIEDVPHSHAAASRAAELARDGQVEAVMKGSLHTDELMRAVVSSASGLRTKRRVSHCFILKTPHYPRPFIVTDAAINLAPTLEQKANIVQNAIDLAQVIGVAKPRVAILAAVETVSPAMPATLDAAALCKMADRGQITGAIVDGPLAFDNAVSIAAAHTKGIVSEVAGQADILVVPDLESGNMLAKQLMYLGDAASAGIVLGAKVPIILTSRSDSEVSRIASCAIAVMLAHNYRISPP